MMRNAFAKLPSGLSIALLTLGMTFGAAQPTLACEAEVFAQTPEKSANAPVSQDQGALADRIFDPDAIVTEPSVIVKVVAPPPKPASYEPALIEAPVVEGQSPVIEEAVETAPATEAMASISKGSQTELPATEPEPQYTGISENEGNALVWYPEVEVMIVAALVEAPVVEGQSPVIEEAVETAPATEAMASISKGSQTELPAKEPEPQYTGISENEGNAVVWYPELEVMIVAAGEELASADE